MRRRSPVTVSSSIWRCATVSESCLRAMSSRSISAAATDSSRVDARRLAIDAGQVLVDLRELILQSGRLAEQPQNHLAAGSRWRVSRSRTLTCKPSRCWLISVMRSRACAICGFERLHIFLVAADLLIQRVEPYAQILRVLLVLRDALLDGPLSLTCAARRPRVRSASTCRSASCWRASVSLYSTS